MGFRTYIFQHNFIDVRSMADDWPMNLDEIVRNSRSLKMKQDAVGETVGVNQRTIHNIEHGTSNPKQKVLYPLIRALSIDLIVIAF